MARGRGDMREVELVELHDAEPAWPREDGDPAAHLPDAAHADRPGLHEGADRRPWAAPPGRASGIRTPPGARTRTRTRDVTLAAIAALLLISTVSSVLGERRETARLRALADVPGVVAPITGPVRELWRAEGWPLASLGRVDGRIVTVMGGAPDSTAAVALDPTTGDAVWRTPLPAEAPDGGPTACATTGSPSQVATRDHPDRPRVLACVVADEMALATDELGLEGVTYPVRARLVVVDAATGEVVADDPVDPTVSVTAIGHDLVLGTVDPYGHARVEGRDPRSGEVHWTFESTEQVGRDPLGLRRVSVRTEGDLVVADAGPVWVLTADGELVRGLPGAAEPFRGYTQVVADGRLVVRRPYEGGPSELVDLATGRSRSVEGGIGTPVPDDRSLPDLLLVVPEDGAGLIAQDVRTGATLWTVEGGDMNAAMVLDGRVVVADGDAIKALDGGTGSLVWSTPVPRLSPSSSMVTDGRVVVVTTAAGSDGALVALDLSDGRQAWSAPVNDQPYYLYAEEGLLYGFGMSGGLRAFGAPAEQG